MNEARQVGILLFPDVELLDFAGPYEVLSSARALGEEGRRLFTVWTAASDGLPVRCRNGLIVQPDYTLLDAPLADVLLVPGGVGTRQARQNRAVIDWIQQQSRGAELTTSVCTGSFLLAEAGLLQGRRATTYWDSIDQLRQEYPRVQVESGVRWVEDGCILSSAGVSAGIDMALYLVSRLHGADTAAATARDIEYEYWQQ